MLFKGFKDSSEILKNGSSPIWSEKNLKSLSRGMGRLFLWENAYFTGAASGAVLISSIWDLRLSIWVSDSKKG